MSHSDPTPPAPAMSSVRQDMRNLSENGGASIAELQSFLGQLRGKSPAEMLGVVAQSRLVASTILATILVASLIALLTVLPFVLNKARPEPRPAPVAVAPAAPAPSPEKSPEASSTATAGSDQATTTSSEDPPPADDLLDTLGIGETKTAPLDVNPLDGGIDDLFNELDE